MRGDVDLQCSRCLDDITVPVDARLEEQFEPTVDVETGRAVKHDDMKTTTSFDRRSSPDGPHRTCAAGAPGGPTDAAALPRRLQGALCPVCGANRNDTDCGHTRNRRTPGGKACGRWISPTSPSTETPTNLESSSVVSPGAGSTETRQQPKENPDNGRNTEAKNIKQASPRSTQPQSHQAPPPRGLPAVPQRALASPCLPHLWYLSWPPGSTGQGRRHRAKLSLARTERKS